ncbi:MAG: glutamate racemase [Verrucomicrobia bacterium RIFCSPHIGHO2_12_FULL_41_10]|nr:MAG: glutamate racemase [Verrucomicrobia bacterium RIFCSPHIGHO2_12_FULL_41_10]HLB34643.1 glutamate racemase [Chthoniobacterales bacterium]
MTPSSSEKPIGVFDSGVGGLTVVAALQRLLPHEKIIYLGDTARVPYGGKSEETVTRYSREIAELLLHKGAKMLVVACNTASALAVPHLQKIYPTPLQGVIDPGATAAIQATHHGIIGVIGTKATVASGAYHKAIHRLNPDLTVISSPCPLLVPLIEEGLFNDEITRTVLRRYLEPMIDQNIDTLVLGCTHYPLLKDTIAEIVGSNVILVDSAENCALTVQKFLASHHLMAPISNQGSLDVMLTDTSEGFLHLAVEALKLKMNSVKTVAL